MNSAANGILKGLNGLSMGAPRVLGARSMGSPTLESHAAQSTAPAPVVMTQSEWQLELAKARAEGARDAEAELSTRVQQQLEADWQKRWDRLQRDNAEKWRALALAMAEQASQLRQSVEDQVTEVAFVVAVRMLGERASQAEWIRTLVQGVLNESGMDDAVRVLLHPDDFEALGRAHIDSPHEGSIAFVADERVQSGGCLIEGPGQSIDARLEVQLSMLRQQLDQVRHARRVEQAAP